MGMKPGKTLSGQHVTHDRKRCTLFSLFFWSLRCTHLKPRSKEPRGRRDPYAPRPLGTSGHGPWIWPVTVRWRGGTEDHESIMYDLPPGPKTGGSIYRPFLDAACTWPFRHRGGTKQEQGRRDPCAPRPLVQAAMCFAQKKRSHVFYV